MDLILSLVSAEVARKVPEPQVPPGLFVQAPPLQGAGTDERTLTRIMISRSEIDLWNIRGEFVDLFDKSLHHMIEVRGHRAATSLSPHLAEPCP